MKKEELMIGDWYIWEAEGKKYYFQVTEETFSLLDDDVFNFQAVPLTPEILEKNGWKWNEYNTMMDLAIGTIHIGWGFYKDCLSISDHSDEGNCQISSLRCKYVHELQHILKLCGIYKQFELLSIGLIS